MPFTTFSSLNPSPQKNSNDHQLSLVLAYSAASELKVLKIQDPVLEQICMALLTAFERKQKKLKVSHLTKLLTLLKDIHQNQQFIDSIKKYYKKHITSIFAGLYHQCAFHFNPSVRVAIHQIFYYLIPIIGKYISKSIMSIFPILLCVVYDSSLKPAIHRRPALKANILPNNTQAVSKLVLDKLFPTKEKLINCIKATCSYEFALSAQKQYIEEMGNHDILDYLFSSHGSLCHVQLLKLWLKPQSSRDLSSGSGSSGSSGSGSSFKQSSPNPSKIGTLESKIKKIKAEMKKTQKNKSTEKHLGRLKSQLAQIEKQMKKINYVQSTLPSSSVSSKASQPLQIEQIKQSAALSALTHCLKLLAIENPDFVTQLCKNIFVSSQYHQFAFIDHMISPFCHFLQMLNEIDPKICIPVMSHFQSSLEWITPNPRNVQYVLICVCLFLQHSNHFFTDKTVTEFVKRSVQQINDCTFLGRLLLSCVSLAKSFNVSTKAIRSTINEYFYFIPSLHPVVIDWNTWCIKSLLLVDSQSAATPNTTPNALPEPLLEMLPEMLPNVLPTALAKSVSVSTKPTQAAKSILSKDLFFHFGQIIKFAKNKKWLFESLEEFYSVFIRKFGSIEQDIQFPVTWSHLKLYSLLITNEPLSQKFPIFQHLLPTKSLLKPLSSFSLHHIQLILEIFPHAIADPHYGPLFIQQACQEKSLIILQALHDQYQAFSSLPIVSKLVESIVSDQILFSQTLQFFSKYPNHVFITQIFQHQDCCISELLYIEENPMNGTNDSQNEIHRNAVQPQSSPTSTSTSNSNSNSNSKPKYPPFSVFLQFKYPSNLADQLAEKSFRLLHIVHKQHNLEKLFDLLIHLKRLNFDKISPKLQVKSFMYALEHSEYFQDESNLVDGLLQDVFRKFYNTLTTRIEFDVESLKSFSIASKYLNNLNNLKLPFPGCQNDTEQMANVLFESLLFPSSAKTLFLKHKRILTSLFMTFCEKCDYSQISLLNQLDSIPLRCFPNLSNEALQSIDLNDETFSSQQNDQNDQNYQNYLDYSTQITKSQTKSLFAFSQVEVAIFQPQTIQSALLGRVLWEQIFEPLYFDSCCLHFANEISRENLNEFDPKSITDTICSTQNPLKLIESLCRLIFHIEKSDLLLTKQQLPLKKAIVNQNDSGDDSDDDSDYDFVVPMQSTIQFPSSISIFYPLIFDRFIHLCKVLFSNESPLYVASKEISEWKNLPLGQQLVKLFGMMEFTSNAVTQTSPSPSPSTNTSTNTSTNSNSKCIQSHFQYSSRLHTPFYLLFVSLSQLISTSFPPLFTLVSQFADFQCHQHPVNPGVYKKQAASESISDGFVKFFNQVLSFSFSESSSESSKSKQKDPFVYFLPIPHWNHYTHPTFEYLFTLLKFPNPVVQTCIFQLLRHAPLYIGHSSALSQSFSSHDYQATTIPKDFLSDPASLISVPHVENQAELICKKVGQMINCSLLYGIPYFPQVLSFDKTVLGMYFMHRSSHLGTWHNTSILSFQLLMDRFQFWLAPSRWYFPSIHSRTPSDINTLFSRTLHMARCAGIQLVKPLVHHTSIVQTLFCTLFHAPISKKIIVLHPLLLLHRFDSDSFFWKDLIPPNIDLVDDDDDDDKNNATTKNNLLSKKKLLQLSNQDYKSTLFFSIPGSCNSWPNWYNVSSTTTFKALNPSLVRLYTLALVDTLPSLVQQIVLDQSLKSSDGIIPYIFTKGPPQLLCSSHFTVNSRLEHSSFPRFNRFDIGCLTISNSPQKILGDYFFSLKSDIWDQFVKRLKFHYPFASFDSQISIKYDQKRFSLTVALEKFLEDDSEGSILSTWRFYLGQSGSGKILVEAPFTRGDASNSIQESDLKTMLYSIRLYLRKGPLIGRQYSLNEKVEFEPLIDPGCEDAGDAGDAGEAGENDGATDDQNQLKNQPSESKQFKTSQLKQKTQPSNSTSPKIPHYLRPLSDWKSPPCMLLCCISFLDQRFSSTFSNVKQCPICYSVFDDRGKLATISCSTCVGKFHQSCIWKWFRQSKKTDCPYCRCEFYS